TSGPRRSWSTAPATSTTWSSRRRSSRSGSRAARTDRSAASYCATPRPARKRRSASTARSSRSVIVRTRIWWRARSRSTRADARTELGELVGEVPEVLRADEDDGARRCRNDRSGALPVRQGADLSEHVPGAEVRQVVAVADHLRGAALDDEELEREPALLHQ